MPKDKTLAVLLLLFYITISVAPKAENTRALAGASSQTNVRFEPSQLSISTNQTFTVSVLIEDTALLYGIDIQITWNTTCLEYVSHIATIPVETYPNGVLHNPLIWVRNDVDENASIPGAAPETRYWLAVTSRFPAATFNGSGSVFDMTFKALNQTGTTMLSFTYIDLSNDKAAPIPYSSFNCAIEILSVHDVAVQNIEFPKTIIAESYVLTFNVTVENHGNSTENFALTARANSSIIQVQNVALTCGSFATVAFNWNTSGFAKGNYTVGSLAETVPGETDTTDNALNYSATIILTLPGDFNGDFKVGPADFALLARAYGATPNKPLWNPNCDINNDQKVGPADFAILSVHYGQHYP